MSHPTQVIQDQDGPSARPLRRCQRRSGIAHGPDGLGALVAHDADDDYSLGRELDTITGTWHIYPLLYSGYTSIKTIACKANLTNHSNSSSSGCCRSWPRLPLATLAMIWYPYRGRSIVRSMNSSLGFRRCLR